MESPEVPYARSGTAKVPLDNVNDAFAAMERQEGIRTVLTFDT